MESKNKCKDVRSPKVLWLALLLLLFTPLINGASGQISYDDGEEHDVTGVIDKYVYVKNALTVVNFKATMADGFGIFVSNEATLNLEAGANADYIIAFSSSNVNLYGGILRETLYVYLGANVTVYGDYFMVGDDPIVHYPGETLYIYNKVLTAYDELGVVLFTGAIQCSAGSVVSLETTGIEAQIDIKPGSYPNSLNINGHGVIPVAILGSADFDVTNINIETLSFAGLELRVKGNGSPQCSIQDVSGDFTNPEGAPDGYPDLVCQFVDNPDNWIPGDGAATLTGELNDGAPFEGTDDIRVVQE